MGFREEAEERGGGCHVWGVILLIALAACDVGTRSEQTIRDLGGYSPVVIGKGFEQDSTSLYRVTDIALGDSAIFIANQGWSEIVVLDWHGAKLNSFGKAGAGPGESQFLGDLNIHGDTLLVYDPLLARVSIWSTQGSYLGSLPVPNIRGEAAEFLGSQTSTLWLLGVSANREATRRSSGLIADSLDVWSYDIASREGALVGRFFSSESFRSVGAHASTTYRLPFAAAGLFLARSFGFVYSPGQSDSVAFVRIDGAREWVALPSRDRPFVTRAEARDRYLDSLLSIAHPAQHDRLRAAIGSVPVDRALPAVSALVGLGPSSLAVGRPRLQGEGGREWLVLANTGGIRGRIRVPENFTVHTGDRDQLVGVWTDTLGVERIGVLRLSR